MHWFPLYPSDFIGATVGLSCQEVSTYSWMLTLYYELGPFPTDPVRTYRIVRCESDEQKRTVDFLLNQFFVLREDGWYQERAEKERVIAAQISDRARQKANKRWHAAPHDATALPQHNHSNARAMPTTATTTTTKEKRVDPIATRLGISQIPEDWIQFCKKERPELDVSATFASFSDYWKAKPGKDGKKLDWFATWRNWVRRQRAPLQKSATPDLPWKGAVNL